MPTPPRTKRKYSPRQRYYYYKNVSTPTAQFLTFDQAQDFMCKYHPDIRSRSQYLTWHKSFNPAFLPRWPHRVWDDFSWNEFLKTDNSFEKTRLSKVGKPKRPVRPMWEAVRWAQAYSKEHGLTSGRLWKEHFKENDIPLDIPKWPAHDYGKDFPGWPVWLGKGVDAAIKTAVEGQVAVCCLHHVVGYEANVVNIKIFAGGRGDLKTDMAGTELGRVYGAWDVERNTMEVMKQALDAFGSQNDGGWIIVDINKLLWFLNMEAQLKMVNLRDG